MAVAPVPAHPHPEALPADLDRLRSFAPAFTTATQRFGRDHGAAVRIDPVRLAAAYLEWRRTMPDYPAQQAAGVLLTELLSHGPLTLLIEAATTDGQIALWPEAYACVTFCLDMRYRLTGDDMANATAFSGLPAWRSLREDFGRDRTSAMRFLDLFADGRQMRTRPTSPRTADRTALRVVATGPALPAGTRLVVLDLAAVSNVDDLATRALSGLLADYGAALEDAEVRRRFLDRPIGLAMTHVGERTGQICPGRFVSHHRQRLAHLLQAELIVTQDAIALIAGLKASGIEARIAVQTGTDEGTLAAVRAQLPHIEITCFETGAGHPDPEGTVVVAASTATIAAAQNAGIASLGIGSDRNRNRDLLSAGAVMVQPDLVGLI